MSEERGLEYQVEQERASVRIIPEDIFKFRDLAPIYGIGSSLRRLVKEGIDCVKASFEGDTGSILKREARILLRLPEWIGVMYWNAGIAVMAESLYLMLKN